MHARSQFAHFDTYEKIEFNRFIYSLNSLLHNTLDKHKQEAITVKSICLVDSQFHARFSCKQKTYAYHIWPQRTRNVFLDGQYWHAPRIRDTARFVAKANECGQYLLGTYDFSSFQDADCQAKSAIRTVDQCVFENASNMIIMKITARSFLQHQIRITVGTIYDIIARDERTDKMKEILDSCNRACAGRTAPASGLFLDQVVY